MPGCYDILAAIEANPHLILSGDVIPAFSLSTRQVGGTDGQDIMWEAQKWV
jgi:hypothetical protein